MAMSALVQPRNVRALYRSSLSSISTHFKCWYRGDSGEMHGKLTKREEELLAVAKPKSEAIYAKHVQMPNVDSISDDALAISFQDKKEGKKEGLELEIRKKRLIYRSKQRGWLEVDLLLGAWANQNVPNLSMTELDEFEAFVNMETIDIYNVITLRMDVPEEMKGGHGVVQKIQDWAKRSPLGQGEPEKYKKFKNDNNLI